MSSVVTRLHTMEISSPVLTSSTSNRVSASLSCSPSNSTGDDILRRQSELRAAGELRISGGSSVHSQNSQQPHANNTSAADNAEPIPSPGPSMDRVPGFVIPVVEGITDEDIHQVEIFYRSQQTQVYVCKSLTNMYLSASKLTQVQSQPQNPTDKKKNGGTSNNASQPQIPPHPSDIAKDEWDFSQTGIPVLVLDTGEHRRERKLRLVLAEKGTGFTLWQDEISHHTRYRTPHTNFHTVSISTDLTRLVGLSFDEGDAATEFAESFRSLVENSEEDLLTASKKNSKKKKEKKPKFKPPRKIDISQPCCFVHVTKLERPDLIGGGVFPPPPSGAELAKLGIPRATSESSGISECSTNPSDH
ncbi:misexpression suppressor of ras [Elysia marginata]|uniref:Misexpression suppressor of ras n=1 Tax=Elysia marginata TaxID=1093978 RepID=A0AAV4FTD0_9GAST|nr:misexpression suppressor of ras [Elysia marginata]